MTTRIRRNVTGLILIDKPHGLSSNYVLQKVKRLFHAEKAGHMGTLDPLASGLLPIALGQATKLSQFLLDAEKTYEVQAKLGERTSTQDAEGEVLESHPLPLDLTLETLNEKLQAFHGEITQIPSMFSALKYKGQALYKLARQGIEVPRKERRVNIFEIRATKYEAPILYFSVRCSKGTYIRSLVDDFGRQLGCGAFVANLRRVGVDQFSIENSVSIETLEVRYQPNNKEGLDVFLLPPELMVSHLPKILLEDEGIRKLGQGQNIPVPENVEGARSGQYQLFNPDSHFFGVVEVDQSHRLLPRKLLFK